MKAIRPETFLILISIFSVFAKDLNNVYNTKKTAQDGSGSLDVPAIDHETLLAEKDEEIRYLKAALEAAKYRLAGKTGIAQDARATDFYSENKNKTLFEQINEKFSEKMAKIGLQLRKIPSIIEQKRLQIINEIRRLMGQGALG